MADQVVTLRITADGKVAVAAVREVADATREMGATAQSGGRAAAKGMDTAAESAKRLTGAGNDARTSMLALVGGLAAVGSLARTMISAADAAGQLRARLKLATTSAEEYAAVQERIEQVSRSSYKSVADITEVFLRSAEPMRQLGRTASETLDLTEALSLGLVVSAASAQKSASAIDAFGKAMQTGALRTEELKTLMETAPYFVEALERSLGKTRAQLFAMAEDGQLTVNELMRVSSQLGQLRADAESMPATLEDAMTRFGTSFMGFADSVNQSTGAIDKMVKSIDWLGKNLDTVAVLAGTVALAHAASAAQALVLDIAQRRAAASALAEAEAQLGKLRAMPPLIVSTETLTAAELRLAQAQAAATAAGVGKIGMLARLGSGLLSLAGGPIGVAVIAVGALVAGYRAVMRAEEERAAKFEKGIAATVRTIQSIDALNEQMERARQNFDAMPSFAAFAGTWSSALADLTAQQEALNSKRAELEALEGRIEAAQRSTSEGASAALISLLPRLERVREEYAALDDVVKRLSGSLESLNFDQLFNPTAAQVAGDMAAQAFAQLTARAKDAEAQIEKNKQGEIGYWQALAQTRIEQARAAGASAERIAAMQAENAALLATIGSTLTKSRAVRASSDESDKAAEAAKKLAESIREFADETDRIARDAGIATILDEDARAAAEYAAEVQDMVEAAIAAKIPLEEVAERIAAMTAAYEAGAPAMRDLQSLLNSAEMATTGSQDQLDDLAAKLSGASASQIAYTKTVRDAERAYLRAGGAADAQAAAIFEGVKAEAAAKQAIDEKIESLTTMEGFLDKYDQKSPIQAMSEDIAEMEQLLGKLPELMGDAFDPAVAEELRKAIRGARLELATQFVGVAKESLQSLQSMSTEGSRAFQALQVAIDATTVAEAVLALIHQLSSGDVYTAIPRMLAVAAAIASLGVSVGNVAGGGFSDTAARRQEQQGTGTVLGDSEAKSESILKAVEITADATTALVGLNRGMLNALRALQAGLGSAANMLARGAGDTDFSDMNLAVGQNKLFTGLDVLGILGGKSKITDQGIIIFGGALMEMLESISVGAYQQVQSRSWAFGSRRTREGIKDITDEVGAQFELILGSIVDTVREGALALGLLPDEIEAALAAYRLEEIRISLKGLDAEEQQKELEAVFSSIFDGLAGSVVPWIDQFQRVGEGLGETLVRVATGVQVTQEAVRQLGFALDETDPEKFAQASEGLIGLMGGIDEMIEGMSSFMSAFATDSHLLSISATALHSAFGQAGLTLPATADGMWDLMQSLDATTDSGREQIATLLRLADASSQYYDLLDSATEFLDEHGLGAAGGLSAFGREIQGIVRSGDEAAEAANAIARAQGRQGASAVQLARISQWTADQIAAAMRRLQQETQDIIAELYGGVPGSLDAIDARIAELESSINGSFDSLADAGENLFEAWRRGVQSVQEYLDSMLLGDLSALTPEEQLAEARRQLEAMQAAALGGDTEALANLPQLADAYLRLLRGFEASGDDYNAGFDWVRELLQGVVGMDSPYSEAGGPSTVTLVPSAELQALYEARDALLAEQEGAHRAALAEQLAQNLHDLAVMLNVPILEMIELQGVSLAALAADLGVDLENLTAGSVQALGNMAATLGVSLTELTGALGLQLTDLSIGLTELTARVGIDLQALTVESTQSLAALATSLGADLSELATAVGVDLGNLADAQSLLNQALAAEINALPAEQSALLAPLLEAITAATSEADANAAIAALEDAINLLAPDIQSLLAPYLAGVFPADALSDLDYLSDIQAIAAQQLDMLGAIRDNLAEQNRAAGVPSYAVGTGFVMGDQLANIHHGEAVVPAAVNAWFRTAGWAPGGGSAANDTVVVELRALRAEVAQLRREKAEQSRAEQETVARAAGDSASRTERAIDGLAAKMPGGRSAAYG